MPGGAKLQPPAGRGTWEGGASSLRVPPRPPSAAPGPCPRPRLEPRALLLWPLLSREGPGGGRPPASPAALSGRPAPCLSTREARSCALAMRPVGGQRPLTPSVSRTLAPLPLTTGRVGHGPRLAGVRTRHRGAAAWTGRGVWGAAGPLPSGPHARSAALALGRQLHVGAQGPQPPSSGHCPSSRHLLCIRSPGLCDFPRLPLG